MTRTKEKNSKVLLKPCIQNSCKWKVWKPEENCLFCQTGLFSKFPQVYSFSLVKKLQWTLHRCVFKGVKSCPRSWRDEEILL